MTKKKKKKIRYDRLAFLFVVLIAVIFLLSQLVSCVMNAVFKDNSEKSESASKSESMVYLFSDSESSEAEYNLTVVIDAGHGGHDTGALDSTETRCEKDDDLEIALMVQSELEKYDDIRIIMTRTDDIFVSLDDRCAAANDISADLFVSIHRNSADIGNGIEIWVNSSNNENDKLLAQKILNKFDLSTITQNRGIKEGYRDESGNEFNYQVNSQTNMPSCLVELGFITDASDNYYFDTYKEQYAKAIADGIVDAAGVLELYP